MLNSKQRFEELKEIVYDHIMSIDNDQQKNALMHLSGVSSLSGLIALKRGLDIDICKSAGLLHDLWLYLHFPLTLDAHKKHGIECSTLIKDMLIKTELYTDTEIETICNMVYHHNDKEEIGNEYEEALKDADELQHFINNFSPEMKVIISGRIKNLCDELNITL